MRPGSRRGREALCVLLGFLLSSAAPAFASGQWDYSARLSLRSFPLGAIFSGTLGYGQLLWSAGADGETGTRPADWRFGYVRPYVTLESIAVANRAEAGIDLFPVSFAGFTIGQRYHHIGSGRNEFDCAALTCTGILSRSFVSGRAALAFGPAFLIAGGRWERLDSEGSRSFVDDETNLIGAGGGDHLLSWTGVAGTRLSETVRLGLLHSAARMGATRNDIDSTYLFGSYRPKAWDGKWELVTGAGRFRSDHLGTELSLIARITWTGRGSLALF